LSVASGRCARGTVVGVANGYEANLNTCLFCHRLQWKQAMK